MKAVKLVREPQEDATRASFFLTPKQRRPNVRLHRGGSEESEEEARGAVQLHPGGSIALALGGDTDEASRGLIRLLTLLRPWRRPFGGAARWTRTLLEGIVIWWCGARRRPPTTRRTRARIRIIASPPPYRTTSLRLATLGLELRGERKTPPGEVEEEKETGYEQGISRRRVPRSVSCSGAAEGLYLSINRPL